MKNKFYKQEKKIMQDRYGVTFIEEDFDLLGDPWAAWLAMGLPWLEIFAGLAVMSGFCVPAACWS